MPLSWRYCFAQTISILSCVSSTCINLLQNNCDIKHKQPESKFILQLYQYESKQQYHLSHNISTKITRQTVRNDMHIRNKQNHNLDGTIIPERVQAMVNYLARPRLLLARGDILTLMAIRHHVSLMLASASVNSISSMPSLVYQCKKALRQHGSERAARARASTPSDVTGVDHPFKSLTRYCRCRILRKQLLLRGSTP
jgi:hypothetical protein